MFTLIQVEPNHLDDLALLFDAYRVFYKKESDLSAAHHMAAGYLPGTYSFPIESRIFFI